jgi:hypothetical protein
LTSKLRPFFISLLIFSSRYFLVKGEGTPGKEFKKTFTWLRPGSGCLFTKSLPFLVNWDQPKLENIERSNLKRPFIDINNRTINDNAAMILFEKLKKEQKIYRDMGPIL